MTNAEREVAYLVTILTFVVGGLLYWRHHERADAIAQFQTKAADSTAKVERDSIAKTSQVAQDALAQAEAAKTQAITQVAVSESLRRVADSVAKTSSAERDSARRLLADSLASVGQYRAEVARLVEAGVRDSAASRASRDADQASIRSLLATVAQDSLALSTEQAHSRSLAAFTATLAQEVKLLRGQQPSFVSRHLGVGPGYVCTKQGCDVGAAVIVRVLP